MKFFRSVLFWSHLAIGVVGGIVIFVMSFTGVVLALRPQIQNWVDRDVRYVVPGGTALGTQALLASVKAARPDANIQSLALVSDPEVAASVNLGSAGNVYVNQYTGQITGAPSAPTSQWFQSMVSWHRYMAATGEWRATGRAWTGASNLGFLLLGLTGLYLWFPKAMTVRHFRPIIWFKRNGTSKARDFNWHNTIGFWCLIPIVIMTASGAVISYPWASNLVYTLTGTPVPPRGGPGGGPGGPAGEGGGRGGRQGGPGGERRPEAAGQVPREGQPRESVAPSGAGAAAAGERRDERRDGAGQPARGGEGREVAQAGGPGRAAATGREGGPGGGRGGERGGEGPGGQNQPTVVPELIDAIVARAGQQMPTWSQLSFRLPNREGGPVAFTITDGAHWNPMARNQLTLDGRSGEVLQWQPYVGQNLGQRARGWMRFAHTGELGGLTGQVVAGIGCLGGVFLVYTGFALAVRRLWNWSLWKRMRTRGAVRAADRHDAALPGGVAVTE